MPNKKNDIARPFIKWVGGKTKLLMNINDIIKKINPKMIDNYIEPFVGGGALFFYLQSSKQFINAVIADINEDLIVAYKIVQTQVSELIKELSLLEQQFQELSLADQEGMFYDIRNKYNLEKIDFDYTIVEVNKWCKRAAKFIFLNKTCFNGLYRQNSKGEFNVPFGKYKKPKICDASNLYNCAAALHNTLIVCGDFEQIESLITPRSLLYLDPPYKPFSKTSSFTKYYKDDFNDQDQIRLAKFCEKLAKQGTQIILSNSDLQHSEMDQQFFERLYPNFDISHVEVMRTISANASKRKIIKELLVKNTQVYN